MFKHSYLLSISWDGSFGIILYLLMIMMYAHEVYLTIDHTNLKWNFW